MKLFTAIIGAAWAVALAVTLFMLRDSPANSSADSMSVFVICESVATLCTFAALIVLYARWFRRRFIVQRADSSRGPTLELVSRRRWILVSLIALCPMAVAYLALGVRDARDPSVWAQRSLVMGAVVNLTMSLSVMLMIQRLRAVGPRTDLRGGVSLS